MFLMPEEADSNLKLLMFLMPEEDELALKITALMFLIFAPTEKKLHDI